MWDMIIKYCAKATPLDWVENIVAVVITLYLSVPGLWWPYVEKWMKKRKEKQQQAEHAEHELPETR